MQRASTTSAKRGKKNTASEAFDSESGAASQPRGADLTAIADASDTGAPSDFDTVIGALTSGVASEPALLPTTTTEERMLRFFHGNVSASARAEETSNAELHVDAAPSVQNDMQMHVDAAPAVQNDTQTHVDATPSAQTGAGTVNAVTLSDLSDDDDAAPSAQHSTPMHHDLVVASTPERSPPRPPTARADAALVTHVETIPAAPGSSIGSTPSSSVPASPSTETSKRLSSPRAGSHKAAGVGAVSSKFAGSARAITTASKLAASMSRERAGTPPAAAANSTVAMDGAAEDSVTLQIAPDGGGNIR